MVVPSKFLPILVILIARRECLIHYFILKFRASFLFCFPPVRAFFLFCFPPVRASFLFCFPPVRASFLFCFPPGGFTETGKKKRATEASRLLDDEGVIHMLNRF